MPMSPLPTICAHNAEGQSILAGTSTKCRMCGCLLELPPGSAAGTPAVAALENTGEVAEYPGESPQENQE